MTISAILIGGFYMFAGLMIFHAVARDRLLDQALEAITLEPTEREEDVEQRRMLTLGSFVFSGGMALATLSIITPVFFVLASLVQAVRLWGYRNEAEQGMRATINAFVIYLASTSFSIWCLVTGLYRPWFGLEVLPSVAVESAAITAVTAAALGWFVYRHKLDY
ncbi:hypothetical protein ACKTEK_10150 [Tepidamorphus sp. 3E244]|uniref:hypothetical protein n=1 Tax=Tepidamorphus sp. 3E244 TaxID=3385498 RepID=UPI0038FCC5F9